jgi:hypothetical protein
MNRTLAVIVLIGALIFVSGCKEGSGFKSPRKREQAEYDCHKDARDKVCEIPWKDKIVLYCYADSVPRVVRFREECK